MSLKAYEENDIKNIANAIRNHNITGNFTVAEMASNIDNIQGGGQPPLNEQIEVQVHGFYYNAYLKLSSVVTQDLNYAIVSSITPSSEGYVGTGYSGQMFDNMENVIKDHDNVRSLAYFFDNSYKYARMSNAGTSAVDTIAGVYDINSRVRINNTNYGQRSNDYGYAFTRTGNLKLWCGNNVVNMANFMCNGEYLYADGFVCGTNVVNMANAYFRARRIVDTVNISPSVRNLYYAYRDCFSALHSEVPYIKANVNAMVGMFYGISPNTQDVGVLYASGSENTSLGFRITTNITNVLGSLIYNGDFSQFGLNTQLFVDSQAKSYVFNQNMTRGFIYGNMNLAAARVIYMYSEAESMNFYGLDQRNENSPELIILCPWGSPYMNFGTQYWSADSSLVYVNTSEFNNLMSDGNVDMYDKDGNVWATMNISAQIDNVRKSHNIAYNITSYTRVNFDGFMNNREGWEQ